MTTVCSWRNSRSTSRWATPSGAVSCTSCAARAVDHLVVSLHRGAPTKNNAGYDDWGPLTSAELLWAAGAAEPSSGAHTADVRIGSVGHVVTDPHTIDWADHDEWFQERNRVFAAASRRTGIAATRLSEELAGTGTRDEIDDPGLDKRPVNVELPPWQRGRYGTSIGRAGARSTAVLRPVGRK